MSLRAIVVFVLAMALIGLAGEAGGEPKREKPRCSLLVPPETPDCRDPQGVWQECPVPLLSAVDCELDILRWQVDDLQDDLDKALASRGDVATAGAEDAGWLRAERDEARRDLAGAVTRARWAWGLGSGGVGLTATGIAMVVGGNRDVGPGLIVGGVVLVALGYVVPAL